MSSRQGGRLTLLLALAALVIPASASAASVTPTTVTGNPGCADLNSGWSELKIDNVPHNQTYSDGTLSVTISNVQDDKTFDWSSTLGVDAVLVKASTETFIYGYDPESSGDTAMGSPGKWAISHVAFCYDTADNPPPPPGDCTGPDSDGDGVMDSCDNCPSVANADQTDANSNGMGDACESGGGGGGGGGTTTTSTEQPQQQPAAQDVAAQQQTPAQPDAQAVLGERVAGGSAKLLAASGCVKSAFSARVRGAGIARVVFTLDGKRIATVRKPDRKGSFSLRVNPAALRVGVHRLAVTVVFNAATRTQSKTLRASFQRCANRLIAPRFTG